MAKKKARGRQQKPTQGALAGALQLPPNAVPLPRKELVLPAAPVERPPDAELEQQLQEVVAITHWFEPVESGRVTLRLSGRRLGLTGREQPTDRFSREETVEVVAGSGPVAVTSKVGSVTSGEWEVSAHLAGQRTPVHRAGWSWARWRVIPAPQGPVRTRLAPLYRPPGLLPGSWLICVLLGAILALVLQSALIARLGVRVDGPLSVSLLSILAGVIGAKAWYLILRRKEGPRDGWIVRRIAEGWAVQGFVLGVILAAPALLLLRGSDVGGYFDATAPALLYGMAVGRLGCFFTGCCVGRPTCSRFGVWSSDRRIGVRRVPAQLLESALAMLSGLAVLGALLSVGPLNGALFVAAIALYTLNRQALLHLRAERRRSRFGSLTVALATGVTLVLDALYVLLDTLAR